MQLDRAAPGKQRRELALRLSGRDDDQRLVAERIVEEEVAQALGEQRRLRRAALGLSSCTTRHRPGSSRQANPAWE
jgi:hypothetical protein